MEHFLAGKYRFSLLSAAKDFCFMHSGLQSFFIFFSGLLARLFVHITNQNFNIITSAESKLMGYTSSELRPFLFTICPVTDE